MQLPRGTFLKIKKNERVGSILDELQQTKFSGICSVSSGQVSGTLVYKSGSCILAKIHRQSGDVAWEEIQRMSGQDTDAALSSMDEAQIQLALEFNKTCRVASPGKTIPPEAHRHQKSSITVHHEPAGTPVAPSRGTPPGKPDVSIHNHPPAVPPARTVGSPRSAGTHKTAAPQPVQHTTARKPAAPAPDLPRIPVHRPPEPENPGEKDEVPEDLSCFERDIDTLEALDLDNMTDKIRSDCKTMIKQLELEHLMER